jgi:hypothetical protein
MMAPYFSMAHGASVAISFSLHFHLNIEWVLTLLINAVFRNDAIFIALFVKGVLSGELDFS